MWFFNSTTKIIKKYDLDVSNTFDEISYDDDGNPQTTNLMDYTAISAMEVPSFDRITMETPTPLNSIGAKGIGESGTIGLCGH